MTFFFSSPFVDSKLSTKHNDLSPQPTVCIREKLLIMTSEIGNPEIEISQIANLKLMNLAPN